MLPEVYPEISIYWKDDKEKSKEYKLAYSRLTVGQLETVGDDTVAVVVVDGMKRAIPIVLDYGSAFSQMNQRLSAMTFITESYFPVIFLEEIYYDAMCYDPVHKANIYHEIGHLYMKHLNRNNSKEQISMERAEAKRNGEVFWQEREADQFACHYVGKDTMISHLTGLKRIIKKLATIDTTFAPGFSEQLEETDQRIKLIQEST